MVTEQITITKSSGMREASGYVTVEPPTADARTDATEVEVRLRESWGSLAATDDERRDWLKASLEGFERWEAEHGLNQDDDV